MDKLTILNRGLRATGNGRINVLNDGSDEWQAADGAFDRGLDDLISRHKWGFAIATADLVEAGTNPSQKYDHAYALGAEVLHLKAVYVDGYLTTAYEVLGRFVCLDVESGVSIEYVAEPAEAAWHPQATEILTRLVEIGCLRALNEDFDEADRRERRLEDRLTEVRSLVDQQNPGRNAYRSTVAEARLRRRG